MLSLKQNIWRFLKRLEEIAASYSEKSPVFIYAWTIILVCSAIVILLTFREYFDPAPYVLFLFVVFTVSWLGSSKAAFLAIGLCSLAQLYYFIPPYFEWPFSKFMTNENFGLLGFIMIASIINILLSTRRYVRNHLDEALKKLNISNARFGAVMESALDSIVIMNSKGRVEEFNPAAEKMFGYARDETIGREMAELIIPPEYREMHRKGLRKYLETGEGRVIGRRVEVEGMRADGSAFDVELAITPINLEGSIYFTGYLRDITDRKQAERHKDDFIRMASHELKTPITSIKAYIQGIGRRLSKSKEEKISNEFQSIVQELDRMTVLINDLLDVSKIESGTLTIRPVELNLNELIADVVQALQPSAPSHEIIFSSNKQAFVFGDPSRLRQVLLNLLTNAIKYSPKADKVWIELQVTDDVVRVEVRDEGIGVPKDQQDKIFDRYHRVLGDDTNIYSGLGLGLYITSEIIRQHNGKISITSEPTKGSSFFFELPAADHRLIQEKS